MLSRKIVFLFFFVFLLQPSHSTTEKITARTIVTQMLNAVKTHTGAQFQMHSSERLMNGKGFQTADMFTKVKMKPRCIYSKILTGDDAGTELLYAEGERNNKVLVNAGKWIPDINFSVYNSMLTKNQHHLFLSSGFVAIYNIINGAVVKADAEKKFDTYFKYEGDVVWNKIACYKITVANPTYAIVDYTALPGENIIAISKKLLIPEYSILELNQTIKSFDEDLSKRKIKVPNAYAKYTMLLISKANNFAIVQEISDDKGLFEKYEFPTLTVNPTFQANEFKSDFKGYNF